MQRTKILFVVLLSVISIIPECSSLYYQVRPTITILAGPKFRSTKVGEYDPDYSSSKEDISNAGLYVIEDPNFGCEGYIPSNRSQYNLTLPRRNSEFVVMLPYLGGGSPCPEYEKALTAQMVWGASALIFRYDPDDPREGNLMDRPARSRKLSGITIATMELEMTPALLNRADYLPRVSIIAHYHPFQTSQTFYFIVFAFCILMLLSCLWFVMSYIKRCHYSVQRRRRRIRRDNATRVAVNRLPVKSFKAIKNTEDPTCAVCLETFHNNDTIRVLPCKHEFHKKCVDPWLKIKQNCPMCKCSITTNNLPSSGSAPAGNDRAAVSPDPPVVAEEGSAENSGVISMVNLRAGMEEEEEADNSTTVSQDSASTQTSDTPLLGTDEPSVETMPYSPQIEVNIEALLPSV